MTTVWKFIRILIPLLLGWLIGAGMLWYAMSGSLICS